MSSSLPACAPGLPQMASRAAAYVRVSTSRQAEHETSLVDQVAAITGYCDARGILLVDVYHEFSHPEEMLASMRQSLSPSGLCALVEFRAEDPNVPIKPEHKMTRAQIMKEWPANGFKLVKEFDGLPWQHLMFFGRDDNKAD